EGLPRFILGSNDRPFRFGADVENLRTAVKGWRI
ncbi:MAG: hypothetical protein ACJAVK_002186, partial [Akkermansiaceae bacterium]